MKFYKYFNILTIISGKISKEYFKTHSNNNSMPDYRPIVKNIINNKTKVK
jgi:hypothetical protein